MASDDCRSEPVSIEDRKTSSRKRGHSFLTGVMTSYMFKEVSAMDNAGMLKTNVHAFGIDLVGYESSRARERIETGKAIGKTVLEGNRGKESPLQRH